MRCLGRNISGKENRKCKGPEVDSVWLCRETARKSMWPEQKEQRGKSRERVEDTLRLAGGKFPGSVEGLSYPRRVR